MTGGHLHPLVTADPPWSKIWASEVAVEGLFFEDLPDCCLEQENGTHGSARYIQYHIVIIIKKCSNN